MITNKLLIRIAFSLIAMFSQAARSISQTDAKILKTSGTVSLVKGVILFHIGRKLCSGPNGNLNLEKLPFPVKKWSILKKSPNAIKATGLLHVVAGLGLIAYPLVSEQERKNNDVDKSMIDLNESLIVI